MSKYRSYTVDQWMESLDRQSRRSWETVCRTIAIVVSAVVVTISATATARATITVTKSDKASVSEWYVNYYFLQSK